MTQAQRRTTTSSMLVTMGMVKMQVTAKFLKKEMETLKMTVGRARRG